MPSRLTPTFFLFGIAILLWVSSTSLSGYLAEPRSQVARGAHKTEAPAELSAEAQKQQSEVESHPDSIAARLAYASALEKDAFEKSDNGLLMEAVQQYSKVLNIQAEQPDALLGLANLCFESGILDKALEYYPRYLKQRPQDSRAKTNYALALVQANQLQEGMVQIEETLKIEPQSFQAHLSKALIYKIQGKTSESEAEAKLAKQFAPGEEERGRVDEFITRLSASMIGGSPEQNVDNEALSPAEVVSAYFKNHPIIGPKLQNISWPELSVAKVAVKDFPVDQMPPFAKEKFLSNMKERLKLLPDRTEVKIVDSSTGTELLTVTVGGEKEASSGSKPAGAE